MATIASELQRMQIAKSDIKDTLESKGVVVDTNKSISNYFLYADKITEKKDFTINTTANAYIQFIYTDIQDDGWIGINYIGVPNTQFYCQYAISNAPILSTTTGLTWKTYDECSKVRLKYGDYIAFKSSNATWSRSESVYQHFVGGGKMIAFGNPTLSFGGGYLYGFYRMMYLTPITEAHIYINLNANYAYQEFFKSCILLKKVKFYNLPTQIMTIGTFKGVFSDCPSLEEYPDFNSVTSFGESSLESAFENDFSLQIAPKLSGADNNMLQGKAFYGMFANCNNLRVGAKLPDHILCGSKTFGKMYYHCTKMRIAPKMSLVTVYNDSFEDMFNQCKSLEEVIFDNQWNYISSSNVLPDGNTYGIVFVNGGCIDIAPSNWEIREYSNYKPHFGIRYATSEYENTIDFIVNTEVVQSYYSTDRGYTWNTFDMSYGSLTFSPGNFPDGYNHEIWFNWELEYSGNGEGVKIELDNFMYVTAFNGDWVQALGDCSNLFEYSTVFNSENQKTIELNNYLAETTLPDYCFKNTFGHSNISIIPELIATHNSNETSYGCYSYMFYNCYNLTDLSNFELGHSYVDNLSYSNMFSNCTALTKIPKISAKYATTNSFSQMFSNCTSLTSVEIPKVTKNSSDGNMFNGMFRGCTSLTSIRLPKIINATNTNNYDDVCQYCSSLTSITIEEDVIANNCLNNITSVNGVLRAPSASLSSLTSLSTWVKIEL